MKRIEDGGAKQKKKAARVRVKPVIRLRHGDALLIIDCINDLEFPGGERMLPWADQLSHTLPPFRDATRAAGIPVIYVNDNFGHWRSNFSDVYRFCSRRGARGRNLSRRMKPHKDDYFILKPRHSGFYATSLEPLLRELRIKRLVLAGVATNLCVLFTAHDAYMHRYQLVVVSDCCAAESDFDHDIALKQLKQFCKADVRRSDEIAMPARSKS